jgi:hypothetical protein
MKKILLFIEIILLIIIVSCERFPQGYKYNTGNFPDTPTNLVDFNSEFDDYNASTPILGETFPICFSSTRNTNGKNYDIVYKLMSISFSRTSGTLEIFDNSSSNLDVYIANENLFEAIKVANSSYDEFGPYLIPIGSSHRPVDKGYQSFQRYILLFSNNESGDQDIKFIHNTVDYEYSTPKKVSFLNSEFDDSYPAFNSDMSVIYFSSNRDGEFDIYMAEIVNDNNLVSILSDSSDVIINKNLRLSSDFNDMCPFISHNFIVFVSNREDGFGGYDLYYSRFENGEWNEPKNFGEKINTEYDEFRPIVRPQGDSSYFSNDFMLFSSNRPGGFGGFDLYYVGIEKIWKGY